MFSIPFAVVSPVQCIERIPLTTTRLLLLRDGSFCIVSRAVSLNNLLTGGYKNTYTNASKISATYRSTYINMSIKAAFLLLLDCIELSRKTQCTI